MTITYGEAKKLLARYAGSSGKCVDSKETDDFTRTVLQNLLLQGAHGAERTFEFMACKGHITLPYELETPLKVKVNGSVGYVWNKWFDYRQGGDFANCPPAQSVLVELNNFTPLVFDLPSKGSVVGVKGFCNESDLAHVIIKGQDTEGREVYTYHKGERIHGEYLTIKKNVITHGVIQWGTIREVYKTITNGYVHLFAVNVANNSNSFLAEYDPYLEHPEFKKAKLSVPCGAYEKVSILGRIRLRDRYADEDRIPFDNRHALQLAGQAIQSTSNENIQVADFTAKTLSNLIEQESNFKRPNTGLSFEIDKSVAGSRIGSIFKRRAMRRGFR